MRLPWSRRPSPTPPAATPPAPIPKQSAAREDGWANYSTKLGVPGRDKTLGSTFEAELIDQETALEIWRGDDLGGRLVELIPQEMTREGWDIQIEEDSETAEAVDKAGRDLEVAWYVQQGLCYGRALGGGGLLMLVDDGVDDLAVPLREDRIRSFKGMNLLTPRELIPVQWYNDLTEPKYAQVAVYRLAPIGTPPGTPLTAFPMVHESRIVRFDGTVTTPRARFGQAMHLGWDDSIFTRVRQPLADFQSAMRGANILMQDFAPAVFKALKLADLLAASKTRGTTLGIADRLNAMEMGSSNAQVKVIDTTEEYKRESVSVAGLPELLERSMLRLAAAGGMPVSLLMGQAPSGLNATGDSDIRWFYDHVAAMREKQARAKLRRIYSLIMLAKDGPTGGKLPENWDISFRPLWQMTPPEIAKMRLDIATADNFYIQNQTLMPEEVAQRFSGDVFKTEIHVDFEERQKLMEAHAERDAAAQVAGREADPEGPEATQAEAAKKALEEPVADPAKKDPKKAKADALYAKLLEGEPDADAKRRDFLRLNATLIAETDPEES